jgi:hypothetical protein
MQDRGIWEHEPLSTPLSVPSSILTDASRMAGTEPALDDDACAFKRVALGTETLGDGPAAGESAPMLSRSSVDKTELESAFRFGLRDGFVAVAARGGGAACESCSLDARKAPSIFSEPRMESISFSDEPANACAMSSQSLTFSRDSFMSSSSRSASGNEPLPWENQNSVHTIS